MADGLGAIAGVTIFIGLPVARLRGLGLHFQGFLNALATGVLIYLLWDILSHAVVPVNLALGTTKHAGTGNFGLLVLLFGAGLIIGLLSLVYLNAQVLRRVLRPATSRIRGTTLLSWPADGAPSPRLLSMMIAIGLGLHNLSEGLAIGQSAATGALAFAGVLMLGFALHNVTEGFGIAAPMAGGSVPVSWGFLGLTGLVGGVPTFLGAVIGYMADSPYFYIVFLALAAGALIYVLNELFALGKRLCTPAGMGWGLALGFLAAYSSDLVLTYFAG